MTNTSINHTAKDTPPPQPIRIQNPGDIVELVPYLLGFHPADSLVLVGIEAGTVAVSARIDLAEITRATLTELLDTLALGARCTQAIAVTYTDDRPTADRLPVLIDGAADTAGVSVLDHLLVTRGRWMSLACTDPDCCPPEGTPVHHAGRAATAAVYAGLRVLVDRDALTSVFAPDAGRPDLAAELHHHSEVQLEAIIRGNSEWYHRSAIRALHAAHRAAQAGKLPTDPQTGRFGVALRSYTVRDALWLAVDDGRLPGIELWVNLARRLPAPYDAAPPFLAAWRSYRDGNGALANIAADLALASDPDYTAATLLQSALAHGIDPKVLPTLRQPKRQPERGDATAT